VKSLACVPKLDATLERFRSRPLEGTSPSVRLEAKAVRVRQEGQVVSMAVGGVREEISIPIVKGPSEGCR
jgi:transposase-like protein